MIHENNHGNQLSSQALQHIEGWIEQILTESFLLEAPPEEQQQVHNNNNDKNDKTSLSATEKMRIDRNSLNELGIHDRKQQDQIYRSFFVYCHGVHDFIRTFTKSSISPAHSSTSELSQVLWGTFYKLFQFYDPTMRILYEQAMEESKRKSKRRQLSDIEQKLAKHQAINEELLYHLKQNEFEKSSLNFVSQLDAVYQSAKAQQDQATILHQQREIDILTKELHHLRNFKTIALKTMEVSKTAITSLVQREDSLTRQVNNLTEKIATTETLHEELKQLQKQQEADYFSSKEFIYSQKKTIADLQEQVEQFQDKVHSLESQLRITREQLTSSRELVKDYQYRELQAIDFLQKNQETLSKNQQLVNYLNQSSNCWMEYYEWIRQYREQHYSYNIDEGSSEQSLQQINDLFSALLAYNPLKTAAAQNLGITSDAPPPASTSAVLVELIQSQQAQCQLLSTEYQTLTEDNFHLTPSTMSTLAVLNDFFQDLNHFAESILYYKEMQKKYIATKEVGQAFFHLSDRYAQQNRIEIAEKQVIQQTVSQQLRRIDQLQYDKQELLQVKEKYDKLEPMFLQLVEHYKLITGEKQMLEQTILSLEEERKHLKEKEAQFYSLERKLTDVESDLKDREAYISYLKEDYGKKLKDREQQLSTSNLYESLVPCVHQTLQVTKRIFAVFEKHQKQGSKVYGEENDPNNTRMIAEVFLSSDYMQTIANNKENLLFNDQIAIAPQEINRLVEILDSLLALPKTLNDLIVFTDGFYDLKEEVEKYKVEIEMIKSFSAKERRRIAQQYEDQIQQLRDLMIAKTEEEEEEEAPPVVEE